MKDRGGSEGAWIEEGGGGNIDRKKRNPIKSRSRTNFGNEFLRLELVPQVA